MFVKTSAKHLDCFALRIRIGCSSEASVVVSNTRIMSVRAVYQCTVSCTPLLPSLRNLVMSTVHYSLFTAAHVMTVNGDVYPTHFEVRVFDSTTVALGAAPGAQLLIKYFFRRNLSVNFTLAQDRFSLAVIAPAGKCVATDAMAPSRWTNESSCCATFRKPGSSTR
jgi:hypothetical protein